MRDFIAYVARQLVDQPDQVEVDVSEMAGVVTFMLSVAPDDIGKVIGKQGRTVQAIRALLSAAAAGTGKRVVLDLPEG